MDVFELDKAVVGQYEKFARSFTDIRSPELREKVDALYESKRFWPDPLIQLNPHFEPGKSVWDFVLEGDLEPECAEVFQNRSAASDEEDRTLKLHKHQQQAVGYAISGKSYVVTTGSARAETFPEARIWAR